MKLTGSSSLCLFHADSRIRFSISWLKFICKRCRVFQSLKTQKNSLVEIYNTLKGSRVMQFLTVSTFYRIKKLKKGQACFMGTHNSPQCIWGFSQIFLPPQSPHWSPLFSSFWIAAARRSFGPPSDSKAETKGNKM